MPPANRSSGPFELSASSDIVVLRVARGGPVLSVMRVVMSGIASRHDVPLERLDDVQLAVETLLAEEPKAGCELALSVSVDSSRLSVRLEGLTNSVLKTALMATHPFQPCAGCLLDVRLLLDSLVDAYRVLEGTSGQFGVEMEKRAS